MEIPMMKGSSVVTSSHVCSPHLWLEETDAPRESLMAEARIPAPTSASVHLHGHEDQKSTFNSVTHEAAPSSASRRLLVIGTPSSHTLFTPTPLSPLTPIVSLFPPSFLLSWSVCLFLSLSFFPCLSLLTPFIYLFFFFAFSFASFFISLSLHLALTTPPMLRISLLYFIFFSLFLPPPPPSLFSAPPPCPSLHHTSLCLPWMPLCLPQPSVSSPQSIFLPRYP